MRRIHLNLTAIRESCTPAQAPSSEHLVLSRRQALGVAGVMAVGASPALKTLERFGTRIEVQGDAHRVAFLLDGNERWVIDTRRFAGAPRLLLERREGSVRVTLTGARYPGTDLSADLTAELREGMLSPRIILQMSFGHFRAESSAEKFLSGRAPLRSPVVLGRNAERLAAGTSLSLGGRAVAEYRPDWTLRLKGSHVASITTPTGRLPSTVATIALLDPTHPSVFSRVPAQRSRITLRRGDAHWKLSALLSPRVERHGSNPGGTLEGTFDLAHVELSEEQKALIAEANGEHVPLTFQPNGSLLDIDEKRFRYQLQNPRFVLVFGHNADRTNRRSSASQSLTNAGMQNGSNLRITSNTVRTTFSPVADEHVANGHGFVNHRVSETEVQSYTSRGGEWALIARFHQNSVWLRTEGFALEVGDGPGATLFELTGRNGKQQLIAAPALLKIAIPVAGAITEPMAPKHPTRLLLHHSRMKPKAVDGVAHIRTHPQRGGLHELFVQNLTVSLLRPQDMLVVTLEYSNTTLQVGGGQAPRLVPDFTASPPPYVIAHFPPQHVGEQAFYQETNPPEGPSLTGSPIQSRLAGPSRLVFSIPQTATQIPFAVESLLDWTGFTQIVPITATRPGQTEIFPPAISQPQDNETSIEAPYRVMLSPNNAAGWVHSPTDVTHGGITELWHTRLGVQDATGVHETGHDSLRTARAVWSPDYKTGSLPFPFGDARDTADPFRMSLDENDRDQIVRLSSDYSLATYPYSPPALTVDRLMLSSLGAWMELHGVWPEMSGFDLAAWRHRMAMGRDSYVRVVKRGYLFPFGHQAAYVKVTERKPYTPRGQHGVGTTVMALLQRSFVVVMQPEKTYNSTDYPSGWDAGKGGRKTPFRKLRLTTLTTPDLTDPTGAGGGGVSVTVGNPAQSVNLGKYAFWPSVSGVSVPFHMIGEDRNGQTVEFATPLIFVSSIIALPPSPSAPPPYPNDKLQLLQSIEQAYVRDARRIVAMNGQSIALAPRSTAPLDPSKPVDTAVEADTMEFDADIVLPISISTPSGTPRFFPTMVRTNARVPALKGILGAAALNSIKYNATYLDAGLGPGAATSEKISANASPSDNMGQVFADFENPPSLAFGHGDSGQPVTPGVAQPNMPISALSAIRGAAHGSASDLATGAFDPVSAFGNAKLLGGISLADLLKKSGALKITDPSKIPQMVTTNLPDAIEYTYVWKTDVGDIGDFFQGSRDGNKAAMSLTATAHVSLNGGSPAYGIEGKISDFTLSFGVLGLPFSGLTFTIEAGKKMMVNADVGAVEFIGFLSFLEAVRKFMSSFLDPPYLDVELDHIEAGYTFAIPDITMGAFSIQNVSLGAGLVIPFFGDPVRLTFYFATRDNPFLVTVYIFGGGGHFGLSASAHGLETIEASIEMGANIDINLGVAEGSARVMIGFSMTWNIKSDSGVLTGFVDISGNLTVLGLLSVSIQLVISLEYDTGSGKVAGEAVLKIEVSIAMFSKSVTIGPVRKEFAGTGGSSSASHHLRGLIATGGAKIADVLTQDDWVQYCGAFA